ncbi:MAG: hypothetical protein METHP_01858 [Methanoregula sp. SKADARSKE-2]|nr:MAG: hypothetical protein METHP_01858 [Methanoregula sp. SKADARSKE-2]
MKKILPVLAMLDTIIAVAGCTGTTTGAQESSNGGLRAHYEYLESWGLTQGCYGKVTGYIYNAGSQPEDKAQLDFNLIDASSGTIRDSRSLSIGRLNAGQSRTYAITLDGDCSRNYRVEPVWGR